MGRGGGKEGTDGRGRLTAGVSPLRDEDPRPREAAELLRGGRERRLCAGLEAVDAPRERRAARVAAFPPVWRSRSAGGAEGDPFVGVAVFHFDGLVRGVCSSEGGRSVELRIEGVKVEVEVEVDWTVEGGFTTDEGWRGRHVTRPGCSPAFDVILSLVCPGMPVLCLSGSCYGDWEARWGWGCDSRSHAGGRG